MAHKSEDSLWSLKKPLQTSCLELILYPGHTLESPGAYFKNRNAQALPLQRVTELVRVGLGHELFFQNFPGDPMHSQAWLL